MADIKSSLFGKLALATKQVTADQIRECLLMQQEYEKQGRKAPRLGELLAAKGYLSADQVRELLKKQAAASPPAPAAPGPDPVKAVAGKSSDSDTEPPADGGETFGEFKIMKRLGADSSGYTYKAKYLPKDMAVTLRVLSKERMEADPEYVRRFEEQAKKANELRHPGIQRVVAAGRKHGRDFYAAEYIEGISLKRVLEARGKLDVPFALDVAVQALEALEYGHARGVFHQEVRPSNILITPEKKARLVAFGVAHDVIGNVRRLAGQTGELPFYIAPEQAVDDGSYRCDSRTDLYCLGVTLYHALTGEPPFKGDSVEEVLLNLAEEEVADPALLNPAVPARLATAILCMMNPEPDARYQTAGDLLKELREIRNLPEVSAGGDDTKSDSAGETTFRSRSFAPAKGKAKFAPPAGARPGHGHGQTKDKDGEGRRPRRKSGSDNSTLIIVGAVALVMVAVGIGVYVASKKQQAPAPVVTTPTAPAAPAQTVATTPTATPAAAPADEPKAGTVAEAKPENVAAKQKKSAAATPIEPVQPAEQPAAQPAQKKSEPAAEPTAEEPPANWKGPSWLQGGD